MTNSQGRKGSGKKRKVRVDFKRNRSAPPRDKSWTRQAKLGDDEDVDARQHEAMATKGELTRRRTIIVDENDGLAKSNLPLGTVVAVRGLYADVDDGQHIWSCTIRRILRTRRIKERHPITVGDHVRFLLSPSAKGVRREGVIEAVEPRRGELRRMVRRRIQTIVANVDQAIIVSSAAEPYPKPHLIDRYIVAALKGDIVPVICMNKVDLDPQRKFESILHRYDGLDYTFIETSAADGTGIEALRDALRGKASVIAGQSGVGKSSLLNALEPGLNLRVAEVARVTAKGRHTTTTAKLLRLSFGGYVVDTPGIKSFELTTIDRNEFEAFFEDFLAYIPNCKFADCTHTHEICCAVKEAVEAGAIHPDRYESYVRLFEEPGV